MSKSIRTPQDVGGVLRASRVKQRLSQADLARGLGISQARYSTLESSPGRLTLDRLLPLLQALGLTLRIETSEPAAPAPPRQEW